MGEWAKGDDRRRNDVRVVVPHLDDSSIEGSAGDTGLEKKLVVQG